MLRKVISGGQTGADQGALNGATLAAVSTGGTAPKDFRTEEGNVRAKLQFWNLSECASSDYRIRTRSNVRNSDGTLIIGRAPLSGGSSLTARYCENQPLYQYNWPNGADQDLAVRAIAQWILTNEIRTLNVAGNRESKNPGIFAATSELILKLCGAVNGPDSR